MRRPILALLVILLTLAAARPALAQAHDPADAAQQVRRALFAAQRAADGDREAAVAAVGEAELDYKQVLAQPIGGVDAALAARLEQAFAAARTAAEAGAVPELALARGRVWAGLLHASSLLVQEALARGDADNARAWLLLREFRTATKFSRPAANATLALQALLAGQRTAPEALAAVRADLYDTYQAQLNDALADADQAAQRGFAARLAEQAGLAQGYFELLAASYAEQRGAPARASAQATFAAMVEAALTGDAAALQQARAAIDAALQGFRAAPLSEADQARRAGQLLRFIGLVPVEYARGVRSGRVVHDIEIQEALTFRDGAAAAFTDLEPALSQRDRAATARVAELLRATEAHIRATAAPAAVEASTSEVRTLLETLLPPEWQKRDNSADFDVIQAALDQMEAALDAGQYAQAEQARLEAYAILESGPEAKLVVYAPEMKPLIENLFWYGQDERKGLAYLIAQHAPAPEVKASRAALNLQLAAAQQALKGNNAPAAVATNAAIIVFREGLEAVLILASLMGSMKLGEQRRFRRPLWAGAAAAFVASMLTWLLARGALTALARYGERLEAVVSLVAIAVLLLITNWFFHDVYWKGWMASFHQQKRRIVAGSMGQWLGLVLLGFTSIYREGFETVLFLQALVLEAGASTVLGGTAVGLGITFLVGLLVFVVQAKLPHKKMLIATGIMIGAVLLQMVGNTVHVLQIVGWLSLHPIRWLVLPHWAGLWFGLFATWEGIALQLAAAIFVVGSYFLAEWANRRKVAAVVAKVTGDRLQVTAGVHQDAAP